MCFNSKFRPGPNLSFFGLGPWAIIHGMAKLANNFISRILTLMVPFERYLSKLSEKHNIFDFRSTEFKLWQLKDSQNQRGWGCLSENHKIVEIGPRTLTEPCNYFITGL